MKKLIFLIVIFFTFQNCNKVKNNIKEKMHIPDYSYKEAGIDQFYYSYTDLGNTPVFPLIKPFKILKVGNPREWLLDTDLGGIDNELGGNISPLVYFNVVENFIYGYKSEYKDDKIPDFNMPQKWFILNTQDKKLQYFDKESDFKARLKKLNLPETFLSPDEVYEQYKQDPVLPWFPEGIKKQLQEVKAKKENK